MSVKLMAEAPFRCHHSCARRIFIASAMAGHGQVMAGTRWKQGTSRDRVEAGYLVEAGYPVEAGDPVETASTLPTAS